MLSKKITQHLCMTALFFNFLCMQAEARILPCQNGPALQSFISTQAGENLACLDSVSTGNQVRAIFFISSPNPKLSSRRLLVIADFALTPSALATSAPTVTLVKQVQINDPELFPSKCGYYFMGARALFSQNQFLGFYAHNEIRLIDFTDPLHPIEKKIHDEHPEGVAYSCEGYDPNWLGGRRGVNLNLETRSLTLTSYSPDWSEKIEEKTLNDEQIDFYKRAYHLECTGKHSPKESPECLDLKMAKEEGILRIRTPYHAEITSSVSF